MVFTSGTRVGFEVGRTAGLHCSHSLGAGFEAVLQCERLPQLDMSKHVYM